VVSKEKKSCLRALRRVKRKWWSNFNRKWFIVP
jgi:hypothetical protein